MHFIPRYAPQSPAGRSARKDAALHVAGLLACAPGATLVPVGAGRVGIRLLFEALARGDNRRTVVMSAQACPIVPRVVLACGFTPFFADVDPAVASPGARELTMAYEAAGGRDRVAAVIASPIYGYAPPGIGDLKHALGQNVKLLADFAQGALIDGEGASLVAAADAAIFSFGVGKGADTGGGLLAVRDIPISGLPPAQELAGSVALVRLLRTVETLGLCRWLTPYLDRQGDKDARPDAAEFKTEILTEDAFNVLAPALDRFRSDVARARQRAQILFENRILRNVCRDVDVYASSQFTHLRQILRLRDPGRRAPVLARLRAAGIDALPAGEKLPSRYLAATQYETCGDWYNARQFLADAIRLPFLARLNDRAFDHLLKTLEDALG